MKQSPFFKTVTWLACGIVLSQLIFSAAAILVSAKILEGAFVQILFVFAVSAFSGFLLARKASRRATLLLGACIALHLPGQHALYYLAALIQDLYRGGPLPGASIRAVMAASPSISIMSVMVVIALIITATGLLTGSNHLFTRCKRGRSTPELDAL